MDLEIIDSIIFSLTVIVVFILSLIFYFRYSRIEEQKDAARWEEYRSTQNENKFLYAENEVLKSRIADFENKK